MNVGNTLSIEKGRWEDNEFSELLVFETSCVLGSTRFEYLVDIRFRG